MVGATQVTAQIKRIGAVARGSHGFGRDLQTVHVEGSRAAFQGEGDLMPIPVGEVVMAGAREGIGGAAIVTRDLDATGLGEGRVVL